MPYITTDDRKKLDKLIDAVANQLHQNNNVGEYNYVISRLIHEFIRKNGLRYQFLNAAVGILECAKAEFIRTVVSTYEDKKAEENCAVSELDAHGMGWPRWLDNSKDGKYRDYPEGEN